MNWWNRPKITPLQMILYTGSMFYFLFLNTEFFAGLDDFVKYIIFTGVMLLSYLLGYSAIDSKRLGIKIWNIWRNPLKDLNEKYEEVFTILDAVLFHEQQKKEKKKNKKKVKK